MQELQQYDSDDQSESASEPCPERSNDNPALTQQAALFGRLGTAEVLPAIKHIPVSSSSKIAASATQLSSGLPASTQSALPAPSALLDLPLHALGTVHSPHAQGIYQHRPISAAEMHAGNLDLPQLPSSQSSKHQGRKRSFAHIEGNFPTHVYTKSRIAT